ncbi:hypothetical protein [Bradyrhizobium sp.]|uniref:hypothetical protein n=1 Tax=Bradyrhizobium sp. TaxID=376 RepID=UPI0034158146
MGDGDCRRLQAPEGPQPKVGRDGQAKSFSPTGLPIEAFEYLPLEILGAAEFISSAVTYAVFLCCWVDLAAIDRFSIDFRRVPALEMSKSTSAAK